MSGDKVERMTSGIDEASDAFEQDISSGDQASKEKSTDAPERLLARRAEDEEETEGGRNLDASGKKRRKSEEDKEDEESDDEETVDEDDESSEDPGDEGDEKSGDDDAEGDDEEEEDSEGDSGKLDLNQTVLIKVDGQDEEVTVKEALQGYIRRQTFDRRLGKLNETQTNLENSLNQIEDVRGKYIEKLDTLLQMIESFDVKEPSEAELDALYASDPAKGRALEKQWRDFKAQKEGIKAQKTAAEGEQTQAQKARSIEWVKGEQRKAFQEHPEWRDETVRARDFARMRKTGRSVGYTDDELDYLYDSRQISVLMKAAKYDRMMAAKPKSVNKGKDTEKPGSASASRRPAPKGNSAMKRLQRTGSVNDAAAAFRSLI